ncbi:hypothetical protein Btru_058886 [Bulinus truncatus]|nr:hypothetical protein Btru_058886 [Bulinus truncatus]
MLEDLLSGLEKSRFILVKDSADCSGRHLLLNWVKNLSKRITFIDGNRDITLSNEGDGDILFERVIRDVNCGSSGILFDSLTLPILLKQVPQTCLTLHRLFTHENVVQVVALLHKDVHDPHTCDLVGSLATSLVDIAESSQMKYKCNIRHCRVTGKVFKSSESVTFDSQLNITKIEPWTSTNVPDSTTPTNQTDPLAQLSFNLSLTATEKDARSQVQLPYLKVRSIDEEEKSSSGRIIYHPDEADDIDEEDPDDDLNI